MVSSTVPCLDAGPNFSLKASPYKANQWPSDFGLLPKPLGLFSFKGSLGQLSQGERTVLARRILGLESC